MPPLRTYRIPMDIYVEALHVTSAVTAATALLQDVEGVNYITRGAGVITGYKITGPPEDVGAGDAVELVGAGWFS